MTIAKRESLADDLVGASSRFSERALLCHSHDDWEGFIVHGSTAVELMAKSVLVRVNPLLIADARHEETIIMLAAAPDSHRVTATARTIGAEKALTRAEALGVPFGALQPDVKAMREARNGIVHLGRFDDAVIERAFDGWIRLMTALSTHSKLDSEQVFGQYSDAVAIYRRESAGREEEQCVARLVAAKARWNELLTQLSEDEVWSRSNKLEAEFVRANLDDPAIQWSYCPVCDSPANLAGHLVPHADYDVGDGEVYIAGIFHEFKPDSFSCGVCGLKLDTRLLIERSGVLDNWEIEKDDLHRWAGYISEAEIYSDDW